MGFIPKSNRDKIIAIKSRLIYRERYQQKLKIWKESKDS